MGSATRASGAVGWVNDEVVLELAQFQSPLFWRVGENGDMLGQSVLAFGGVYDSLENAPPGSEKAFLREVLFAEDITGEGDAAFLLTSSDGYLYALGMGGTSCGPGQWEAQQALPPSLMGMRMAWLKSLFRRSRGDYRPGSNALVAPEWVHEVVA